MELTDTHCHIFLPEFDPDRDSVLDRASHLGVNRIFMPNVDSSTAQAILAAAANYPGRCFPMMGLHPTSVGENFELELQIAEKYLSEQTFYGIGEVGIDLYWDKTWQEQQEEAFRIQLGWAHSRNLPVIIHVRNSFDETMRILHHAALPGLKGIFHCFTGTLAQAREVIDLGFHLGIGGVATFKNGGLDQVLPHVDPKWIMLETDSPYLAPAPHRGKRNEPSYIPLIASRVADLLSTSPLHISELTTRNSKLLFGV
jgi:TatD DNase family protein